MDSGLEENVEDPVIAILEGAFGAPPPKDNPLALLFMVCVSIASVAGLVWLIFFLAGYQASPAIQGICVVSGWIFAFLFGRSVGDKAGLNDKQPTTSLGDGVVGSLTEKGGMMGGMGLGCVLAILQFLFGGLYNGIAALAGWNAPKIDMARAAAILRAIYNEPEKVLSLQAVAAALETRSLGTDRKGLFATLRKLVEKDLIRGNPQTGFTGNPAKVNRLRK